MKAIRVATILAILAVCQATTLASWAQEKVRFGVSAFLCDGASESVPILVLETSEGLEWNIDRRTVERRGQDFAVYDEAEPHFRVYLNHLGDDTWKLTTIDFGEIDSQFCREVTGLVTPIAEYASGLALGRVSNLEKQIADLRNEVQYQERNIRRLGSLNSDLRKNLNSQVGLNQKELSVLCRAVNDVLDDEQLGVQQRLVLKTNSRICR